MSLDLFLKRQHGTEGFTAGQLFVGETRQCYTLEDQERDTKIFGETAIPCGRFQIALHNSPHFGCVLPHLLNVPGYEYVLIHWGNKVQDTEGCILVGADDGNWQDAWLGHSKVAFNALFPIIMAALNKGEEVWITIS